MFCTQLTKILTQSLDFKLSLNTSQNFLNSLNPIINLLINLISPPVYEYIADFTTYDEAISKLNELYIKPSNGIFTRHKLATRK